MPTMTRVANKLAIGVRRDELLRALALCATTNSKSSTIPILSNVKLVAENERLRIVQTDLETTVKASIAAEIQHPGAITVEAKALFDAARSSTGDTVNLTIAEASSERAAGRIAIECGTAKFQLYTQPAEDFPVEPEASGGQIIEIGSATLKVLLGAVQHALTHEETRFQLNGVLIESSKKSVVFVATDGHRMAMATLNTRPSVELKSMMPRSLVRAVDKITGDMAFLQFGDHASVIDGDNAILCRALDANFPNYREVIAQLDRHALADRAKLLAAIRRVANFSHERTRAVRLQFKKGRLEISCANIERGDAFDVVAVDYAGEECFVGMNANYIAQAIEAVDTDMVRLSFADAESQLQIRQEPPGEMIEQVHVVMPMRLS
jgi:DNA polymerase-3 subunit beta